MEIRRVNPGSAQVMEELLHSLLPGESVAIRLLREQVFEFCVSPVSRAALILGPIGGGKSVLATLIAYLKRIAPLDHPSASRLVRDIRFQKGKRIDPRVMTPWYVEMPLTGIVDSLAEAQLFGVVKGAYTGATEDREGIFERAAGGDSPDKAQALTGGVVFLDEVGDLSKPLQAKLLPVLSQGVYYRIGAEGKSRHQHQFDGVVVAATWRKPQDHLRPDLLSRFSQHVITVPSLAEREADLDAILIDLEQECLQTYHARLDRLSKTPDADQDYWEQQKRTAVGLSQTDREQLRRVDWGRHGNLRGLTGAVERVLVGGRSTERVIAELPVAAEGQLSHGAGLLERLLQRSGDGGGVAGHVQAVVREMRSELKRAIKNDRGARLELAERLGIDEARLAYQVDQLDRDRVKRGPGRSSK